MRTDEIFIDNVKSILEKKGITQFQLADKCDLSDVTLSRIMHCKRPLKLGVAVMIANALEVDISELLKERSNEEQ